MLIVFQILIVFQNKLLAATPQHTQDRKVICCIQYACVYLTVLQFKTLPKGTSAEMKSDKKDESRKMHVIDDMQYFSAVRSNLLTTIHYSHVQPSTNLNRTSTLSSEHVTSINIWQINSVFNQIFYKLSSCQMVQFHHVHNSCQQLT